VTEKEVVVSGHRPDGCEVDAGITRAGAAVAAKRRELGIAQRRLARAGVINAGALIAFEKGRSWPRQETRARLEQVLGWPPGAIGRIRSGEPAPLTQIAVQPDSDNSVALLVGALRTAITAADAAIAGLPNDDDAQFCGRATQILAGLRGLETLVVNAVSRTTSSPALAVVLSAVRRLHHDLMCRAAESPSGTLGQRLFAARREAALTVDDVALATGLTVHAINAAEADDDLMPEAVSAIESFVTALRGQWEGTGRQLPGRKPAVDDALADERRNVAHNDCRIAGCAELGCSDSE
jgi:transcriptional regulator with XRE-family HTH domain